MSSELPAAGAGEQPQDGVYLIAWNLNTTQDSGKHVFATVKGKWVEGEVGQTFPVYGEPLHQPVVDPDCHVCMHCLVMLLSPIFTNT